MRGKHPACVESWREKETEQRQKRRTTGDEQTPGAGAAQINTRTAGSARCWWLGVPDLSWRELLRLARLLWLPVSLTITVLWGTKLLLLPARLLLRLSKLLAGWLRSTPSLLFMGCLFSLRTGLLRLCRPRRRACPSGR